MSSTAQNLLQLPLHLTARQEVEVEEAPASSYAVGDNDGAAWLRWKMRQLRCDREAEGQRRVGGLFGWRQEKKLDLSPNWTEICSLQISIHLNLLLLVLL